jgi:hypothetical protein
VKWFNGDNNLKYENINHYFAERFWLWTAKDRYHSAFNGRIGYLNVNLGDGSFRIKDDFTHPNDIYGYDKGFKALRSGD